MNHRSSLIGFCLLAASVISPTVVFAKVTDATPVEVVVSPSPIISGEVLGTAVVKKVDYLLPYPGLLLDSPLYFLKHLRDIILEKLIVDPIRKSEFYILQTDKFVSMALYLGDKGNAQGVGKAITLAQKNITLAVNNLLALKGSGVAIPATVTDKLQNATAKYIEVLTELQAKVDASQKDVISGFISAVKTLQGELPKLK